MLRLRNPVQPYDWGSRRYIQGLLGLPPGGTPIAELWLGAHPLASSTVAEGPDEGASLAQLIETRPERLLGEDVIRRFGARLPYLLKVLAADRPLSLQVHPTAGQARDGFAREEAAGVPRSAQHRLFRDGRHKPEMLIARSDFRALCGFRGPETVLRLLAGLHGRVADGLRTCLAPGTPDALRLALAAVLREDRYRSASALTEFVGQCARRAGDSAEQAAYAVVADLAKHHPQDPGIVVSLLLNLVRLAPGEALFVPPGMVHAYLEGAAVEVMAASDNVLRAGLTTKHVDVDRFLECTRWEARPPMRVVPEALGTSARLYAPDVEEFGVLCIDVAGDGGGIVVPVQQGPRVVLCTAGAVTFHSGGETRRVRRGESIFVAHDDGALQVTGTGEVVLAFVPIGTSPDAAGRHAVHGAGAGR